MTQPTYVPSGVGWAPMLPAHWRSSNLRWLAKIYAGGTPNKDNLSFWTGGTIPWLNSGSVNDWTITTPSTYITDEAYASSSAKWIPAQSVVIGLAGQGKTKGTSARLEVASTCNQSMAAIVPSAEVDYRFIHYWLVANYQSIRNLAGGDKRDGLNLQHIGSIQVPLPPVAEQSAIADYLDRETAKIDALIVEQQRLIEMLHERRHAVISHAINRSGSSGLDKLGRRTWIGNGSTPARDRKEFWSKGEFPWLNSGVVNQPRVTAADQFVTQAALGECHPPLVPPGSVLVGLTGQGKTRGMATLLDFEATVNQHVAFVAPDRDFWEPEFLMWSLRAAYGDLRLLSDENGSTKGGLTCGDLKSFRVVMPPLDEQRASAEYIGYQTEKIDTLTAETERFIELSRERRAALITAAVTGQIDVRDEVGEGVA